MDSVYGVDLSYSVNKKSYNLIDASKFNEFTINSEEIKGGVNNITSIVSFGDDIYGMVYNKDGDNGKDKIEMLSGFSFNSGKYSSMNEAVKKSLSTFNKYYSSQTNDLIISNAPSCQQIVFFNNRKQKDNHITIELFDDNKKEIAQYDEKDNNNDDEDDKNEVKTTTNGGGNKEKEKEEEQVANGDGNDEDDKQETDKDKEKEKEKETETIKKEKKNKKTAGSISTNSYKVKSAIKKVFKHLLLTKNGSLYATNDNFHKKHVNNNKIIDVKSDGPRATLLLDENGVLWSCGYNLFGKLGLKRNDKKQRYTNPREISIFKAYKVSDFGITNKCSIACCANGNIYGWGSYSKQSLGKDSNIWYTPKKLTTQTDYKTKYKVFAGFRFIMLYNVTLNKLYVINTEFGYTLLEKPKNGLTIKTQQIKLPKDVKVINVIPSNESAIIIAKTNKN